MLHLIFLRALYASVIITFCFSSFSLLSLFLFLQLFFLLVSYMQKYCYFT
ncbi:hypothetical protein BVRB_2g043830 [Beta vulgaris subsp. vulgaris]|nr:hypothetical protein BVRB_2g043830 [Beta vulgaris subsp. vulgaris]